MSDYNPPAIEVIDLVKTFDGGRLRALDDVSFTIEEGSWVALWGPSGCGKSTLLHLIAALDDPTSGRILVHGQDLRHISNLDHYRREVVGLVFQLHNLLPHLTAIENLEVAVLGSKLSHHQQRQRARELLDAVGLGARMDVKPPALSGGERQKLAIARALVNEPSLLLADEPTGSLDSAATQMVLELFGRLRKERNVTLIMVTHDAEVARAADRIIHMRDGSIVSDAQSLTSTVARA
ncbi:MAG TPA: ABC transporter ATP-binding protein [Pirellulales bacterium]|nr:ABC transporter ATP-binding protein [Pirellulales bacterium]